MHESVKILAVDDVQMNLDMLELMLAGVDGVFLKALNGAEALEVLHSHADTDTILLDLEMPVMNGFELLSAVKADDTLKHLPVLMVTAEARKEDIVRAAKDGAAGYIVKPFTKATLEEKVQKIMQKLAATA